MMDIVFYWIGGATFVLSIGNLTIACDPVLCEKGTIQDYFWFKSQRIEQPFYNETTFTNIDMWLITHNHEDHLDRIGFSKIDKNSEVICNQRSRDQFKDFNKLTVLKWNSKKEYFIKGYKIEIEAIPAIHGVSPLSAFFAGRVNGYYLTISKGNERIRIYVTGDTVYKSKIIKPLKNKEIDLMIPNMGAAKEGSWIMTLTLNSKMLAKLITEINPKLVIPVHYGTFEHYVEPVEKIKAIKDERIKIIKVGENFKLNFK